ncbi:hypothetical protein [Fimbriiglobus ruber]|uniref:Uncharacterized protein n=1 Tax=Fimbriiglobus ruber TaxID=1908690 RepID=A0A225DWI4_9BACT|nr:hypothetical protein [Fimbriiglobus ruber]OWK45752.1 hypothetical protein FRUB_02083 [Fimbriiglobus ruber]
MTSWTVTRVDAGPTVTRADLGSRVTRAAVDRRVTRAAGGFRVTVAPRVFRVTRTTARTVVTRTEPAFLVRSAGTIGPQGQQGIQGPPGRDGDLHYTFTQSTAAATWTIAHGLGKFPSVAVVDSSGRWWLGAVQYLDANTLTVSFAAPFAGTAYLN